MDSIGIRCSNITVWNIASEDQNLGSYDIIISVVNYYRGLFAPFPGKLTTLVTQLSYRQQKWGQLGQMRCDLDSQIWHDDFRSMCDVNDTVCGSHWNRNIQLFHRFLLSRGQLVKVCHVK